jgi:transposase-like protein
MEGLKVTFGEALLSRGGGLPPSSAEPDRAFVEGSDQRLVKLRRQHSNLHKRVPALRSVPSFGQPEPPPVPSAPASPSTEEMPVPKPAKKRATPFPPETRRKVLEAIEGGMGQAAAGRKHGVKSQSVVSRWIKLDREEKRKARRASTEPTLRSRPEPPTRGLEAVAKELAEATARVEALKAEMRRLLE